MSLFSKTEYERIALPFICDDNPEDYEAGLISLEAKGIVGDEMKYCYASYTVKMDIYDELKEKLRDTDGKMIIAVIKIKKGKAVDFKFDLKSLSEAYCDERFEKLDLAGWGFNDSSFIDAIRRDREI